MESVDFDLIGSRNFQDSEELRRYLTGRYVKLDNLNIVTEMGKFSTLHQGEFEGAQDYFTRAHRFKRVIDALGETHDQSMVQFAYKELVKYFIYGLRSENFRKTLAQSLENESVRTLEDVLEFVSKWEVIPGQSTPSGLE